MSVSGLLGFGLTVPDLAGAERFYQAFGLETRERDGTLVLNSPGRAQDEGIIIEGPVKRLHHLSFSVHENGYEALLGRLRARGIAVQIEPPARLHRDGVWFRDPWGTWINLSLEQPAPTRSALDLGTNTAGRVERVDVAAWQAIDRDPRPRKLGHVVIFTNDWEETERFYVEVLGFRVTDRVKGRLSFLAPGPGDHHALGLANSTHRAFQHASFEMTGIDDIAFGAQRMFDRGYQKGFGPGRHAVASNLFHYFYDPWGSLTEYYSDMDMITDDWQPRDWETLPIIWGPRVNPDFFVNELFKNREAPRHEGAAAADRRRLTGRKAWGVTEVLPPRGGSRDEQDHRTETLARRAAKPNGERSRATTRAEATSPALSPPKTKVTFYLDTESLDRIRVVCERSPFLTLGGVLSAVCQHLAPQLERLFPPGNGGPVSRAIERACRVSAEEYREVADILDRDQRSRR